jgi:hypothetical protein
LVDLVQPAWQPHSLSVWQMFFPHWANEDCMKFTMGRLPAGFWRSNVVCATGDVPRPAKTVR